MRVDAHQHYWTLSRGDYNWLTADMSKLYRDYGPADLLPELKEYGIDKTIVVQAAATLAETNYLLELAERDHTIAGVVGWIDLADRNCAEHLVRFRRHSKFVGFRIMIQDMSDPRQVLEASYIHALQEIEAIDLPVDLLVTSDQLDVLIELIKHVPNLRGVIDHIAKPRIAEGILEPWKSRMEQLSQYPKLYCKLSGMITEADHLAWRQEHFQAYIAHVLACFGKERVMFGSDWPVCRLAGEYGDVIQVLTRALPSDFTDADYDLLFGANALTFYKLSMK